ncbi:cation:proton antiporter [Halorubrum ezzemoulense]|uniref:NAD-dependent epimerase/dehydratase family protein n=1 Tax=Halorubrum ezzemoulense TaxID=337243 RepID=A0A256IRS8_HALEZ|nr:MULTISPECIES: cation:proton antiporter [Halorubrum]MDB2264130.1 cation:proton antiporter [Halorubrum ezzemoulense]MDB9250610.1 cation:proton antiporter [Halorubrum ezzemoulense]MDB9260725.1 cation:proton antiporter [Halorubrum ezzemoulense]MDB9264114.1 cation:proton antiporter [Halorubrum ezzemoulense]MDB9267618.1 cation:proton antiporter [Halorubrum ezzemoulense]
MSQEFLIPLVAGIIGLGVLAQILAARLRVPSIIFFLLVGVTIGRPGLGIVTSESFGDSLPAIVGLAVAIIVFEGAFHLEFERIRQAPRAAVRLVTVGAGIALVGTAVAVRVLEGLPWELSFVIGALLVATGPTVISPILEVVPVRDQVAAVLETEGIVNDVTAAITAVVLFETVNPTVAGEGLIQGFALRLGEGLLVGLIVAGILYYLLRYVDLSPGAAPRNARLLALAGALAAYAGANQLASEAGVAAAATAGLALGNVDIPYKEEITDFKGDITLLVLAFVFIALAAQLPPAAIFDVGLAGLGVVVVVAVVIRPLLVFVSTVGDRFTFSERLFISAIGPRGIIPASVATLFATELRAAATELNDPALAQQADLLIGTVFLVIFVTALVQGGLARYIAQYLNVIPMRVIIVGGGQVGRALAERLEDRGENVVIIEEDEATVESLRNDGFAAVIGDGTDTEVLRKSGAENAKILVAATGDDDTNLLVAQLSKTNFGVEKILAKANNSDNVDAFEDLGVSTISAAMSAAWAIDNQIERPDLAHWMTDIGETGDVQQIEVTNEELIGKAVREVGPMLPDGCLIAVLSDGDSESVAVPSADTVVNRGDHVTLLGRREAVREGMELVQPD